MTNENNLNLVEEKSSGEKNKFLEFNLGQESYTVPLLAIKEVIPLPETTSLPNGPDYFIGIMNLRGQIISIIDLRKKLRIKPKEEELEEAVVIIEIEEISVGLIVDSINKVLNFSVEDVSEVPEIQSQVNAKYIQGVYRGDERLSILLDLNKILNIAEIKSLSNKVAA